MQTLSYGFLLPDDGDLGPVVFPALEANIQQLNDHTHNGTNSSLLTAASIAGVPVVVPFASWVAFGPTGHYRQLVTLPAGFSYDTVQISFRLSTGEYLTPQVEKISATQYYVYTIDNTLDFVAVYGG